MSTGIQYPFAFDENNNLVFVEDIDVEHRHDHVYHCPNCGHEMLPRLGERNTKHFAHCENQKCGVESYIHQVAKRILADRFNDRSRPFTITFWTHLICKMKEDCKYFEHYKCEDGELKDYDLHSVYDLPAREECRMMYKTGEVFQPDVILSSSSIKHNPIYLEVYHKHKSSPEKIKSGQHIVEIQVAGILDLAKLDSMEIKESESIRFYNFKERWITPMYFRRKAEELATGEDYPDLDYFLPVCLKSRNGKRPYLDHQRIVLYPSGKTYCSGIYQEEMDGHKSNVIADITFLKPRIPDAFNLSAFLIERIPQKMRTCLLCCHCASDMDEENQWCSLVKNGSKRKGTFNEKKGSYCTFFESGANANPENDLVDGVDYTIWVNPKF